MKIINIVDSLAKVNFGIWNSAVSTAQILKKTYNVESELWYPKPTEDLPDAAAFNGCTLREIGSFNPQDVLTDDCVLVSHGCWQIPTRLAHKLHKQFGTPWMYVPHGMLEPWSMQQKKLQKYIYFHFIEKRLSARASCVRAVGSPELINLTHIYKTVDLIPNGVQIESIELNKSVKPIQFLFMARLHHKKGVLPLVKAWNKSELSNNSDYKLVIAGPDDGELQALQSEITESTNVEYRGAVYGADKYKLLAESQFYVLPSYSEGFPTSVVEAMSFGLIPLISEGCNFPEAFNKNLAIALTPNETQIVDALVKAKSLSKYAVSEQSKQCVEFVLRSYSLASVAKKQYDRFTELLADQRYGK